MQVSEE